MEELIKKANVLVEALPYIRAFAGKTVVLELTPKSDQARSQISRIRMWIDEASWLPVQQKFFETSTDDYFLSHYTHVMKNLKIADAKFRPDWPKGVRIEKPRG